MKVFGKVLLSLIVAAFFGFGAVLTYAAGELPVNSNNKDASDAAMSYLLSEIPDLISDLGTVKSVSYDNEKDRLSYSFILDEVSADFFLIADHSKIDKYIPEINSVIKDCFTLIGYPDTTIVTLISAADGPLLLGYENKKNFFTYNGDLENYFENYLGYILSDALPNAPSPNSSDDHSKSRSNAAQEIISTGNKNALRTAKSYLEYSGFSRTGLIEQLKFEGYTNAEAVYAVDACEADWNYQATRVAKDYLDYSGFSRRSLIDQLKYDGFTQSQAEYGVDRSGANWNQQAARVAKSYLDYSGFSRIGLIEQLEYEGFTYAQAVYGVEKNGY